MITSKFWSQIYHDNLIVLILYSPQNPASPVPLFWDLMGLCEPVITHSAAAVGAGAATMGIKPLRHQSRPSLSIPVRTLHLIGCPACQGLPSSLPPLPRHLWGHCEMLQTWETFLPTFGSPSAFLFSSPPSCSPIDIHPLIHFPLASSPFPTYSLPTLQAGYLTPQDLLLAVLPIPVVHIVTRISWLVDWGGVILFFWCVFPSYRNDMFIRVIDIRYHPSSHSWIVQDLPESPRPPSLPLLPPRPFGVSK